MPNRAAELAWDEPTGTSGDGLTRARIVQTALAIADAEGLDAVSIRRVAGDLGARPMSLYSHIAAKEDLVALMLNEVSGRGLVREPLSDDWREAMAQIARAAYSVYLDHPWALSAFGTAPRAGPNLLRRAEQSAQAVEGLDLEPADAWTALRIMHEWTMGHALHAITLREDDQLEDQMRRADPDEFPLTSGVIQAGRDQPADQVFETALAVVLEGIAAHFELP